MTLTEIQKTTEELRTKAAREREIREAIFSNFGIKTEGLDQPTIDTMLKLGGIALDTADEAKNRPPELYVRYTPISWRSSARWQFGMMEIGAQHKVGNSVTYYPAVVQECRWATDQMDLVTRQPNEDAIIHVATDNIKRGFLVGQAVALGQDGVKALVINDARTALARNFPVPAGATQEQREAIAGQVAKAADGELAKTFSLQDGTQRTQLEQRVLNVMTQADALSNPQKREYQSLFAITDRNLARAAGGRRVWGMFHPIYLRRVYPGLNMPDVQETEAPAEMSADVPAEAEDVTQF